MKRAIILCMIGLACCQVSPQVYGARARYRSDMTADQENFFRVGGLALSVQDVQGRPTVLMRGGVFVSKYGWPFPASMMLGTIRAGTAEKLIDQETTWVSNTMTFGQGADALNVTVSRLTPAILLETDNAEISLFGHDGPAAISRIRAADYWLMPIGSNWGHKRTNAERKPELFDGMKQVAGGTIKPLRWAMPGPGGQILTGVLGSQRQMPIPVPFVARAKPLASGRRGPPVDQLNKHWALLWYGADSVYTTSEIPCVYRIHVHTQDERFHPLWPWRERKKSGTYFRTMYQADVPLLLIMQNAPMSITLDEEKGVVFSFIESAGRMALLPLFGQVFPRAEDTEMWLKTFPKEVADRCNAWAERLSRFPVDAEQSVEYKKASDEVVHTESFTFVDVRAGGTSHAPLPATLALAWQMGLPVSFSKEPFDCGLATHYGPAATIPGKGYTWTVKGLAKYIPAPESIPVTHPNAQKLRKSLEEEVEKLVQAGHLAPYIWCTRRPTFGTMYWYDPSEQLYFLSDLMPVLSRPVQEKLRAYLKAEREKYPPETVGRLHPRDGRQRVVWKHDELKDHYVGHKGAFTVDFSSPDPVTLWRAHGLAKYYQASNEKPSEKVLQFCGRMLGNSLQGRQWDTFGWFWGKYTMDYNSHMLQIPRAVSRDCAGALGLIRLCRMAGEEAPADTWGHYARLAIFRYAIACYGRYWGETGMAQMPRDPEVAKYVLRWADLRKPVGWSFIQPYGMNQYYAGLTNGTNYQTNFGQHHMSFLDMAPEIGRIIADWGAIDETEQFLLFYEKRQPVWYMAEADISYGEECALVPPSDSHQLFIASARVAQRPPEKLESFIDVPWTAVGDLFYMHKLAETIKAYSRARGD